MKVILGVEPIFHPLTGIGRYTYELARHLPRTPGVDSVRFFNMGRWVGNPATCERADDQPDTPTTMKRAFGTMRSIAARNPLAVSLYGWVSPHVYRWRLERLTDHVFHAPSFFVPPFRGPLVATVHDLSTVLFPEFHPPARVRLVRAGLKQTFDRADRIIAHTEVGRLEIVEHFGYPANRISVINPGVAPCFQPRNVDQLSPALSALGLCPGAYILCVATIEPRKNIGCLLDAYLSTPLRFRRRFPLVLAGAGGWKSESLHERIRHLAGAGEIRYLHYVPEQQLPLLFSGAKLFVFPSLYEGFGLPVLEAMASGVPVVTSAASCLPEVSGDAALLVDPRDAGAIADALQAGVEDDDWRNAASQRGLAKVAQLDWRNTALRTACAYGDAICDHGRVAV